MLILFTNITNITYIVISITEVATQLLIKLTITNNGNYINSISIAKIIIVILLVLLK